MKHTANVTTVMAEVAQFIAKNGFCYQVAFFYALIVGSNYGVTLMNHEFVMRLSDLLETWDEHKNER